MKYFAYGSNMSLCRLKARVPSAKRMGLYILPEHDLRFHKRSRDGSAKCDAFYTKDLENAVIGALFDIDKSEKEVLDRAEGLGKGYEEKTVEVHNGFGHMVEASTYYATEIDQYLLPYSWYLNHVLVGAREMGVPKQYLERILAIDGIEDPDLARDGRERGIHR